MYGGKFAFQNRSGQLVVGRKFTIFCFVLLCIRGQIPSTSPPGGLYSEGRFNQGFFWVTNLGDLYLEGFIRGGNYFRNFTVFTCKQQNHSFVSNKYLSQSIILQSIIKWPLKNCQAYKFLRTAIAVRFNLLLCPSVPSFLFAVLFIPSFNVLSGYF